LPPPSGTGGVTGRGDAAAAADVLAALDEPAQRLPLGMFLPCEFMAVPFLGSSFASSLTQQGQGCRPGTGIRNRHLGDIAALVELLLGESAGRVRGARKIEASYGQEGMARAAVGSRLANDLL
jgi:hypothetical protein